MVMLLEVVAVVCMVDSSLGKEQWFVVEHVEAFGTACTVES